MVKRSSNSKEISQHSSENIQLNFDLAGESTSNFRLL